MSRVLGNFGNWLVRVGVFLGGQMPPKTLQVIFHFGPSFELLADYYDPSWSPRDGAMFGKSYPLHNRVLAVYEAVEYARSNQYTRVQFDAMPWGKPPQPVRTLEVVPVH